MTVYELMQWLEQQNPASEVEIIGAYHRDDPSRPEGQGWRCFHYTSIIHVSEPEDDVEEDWQPSITVDLYNFSAELEVAS